MLLSIPLQSRAQQELATEKWREPAKIFPHRLSANSYGTIADHPTDNLYYLDTTLAAAHRIDNQWNGPHYLNIENASYLAKHPAISRSGNRLYYIDWKSGGVGAWDLYVSRYDSVNDRWGPGRLLPPPINSPETEWCAYAPNDTTLIWGRGTIVSSLYISYKTGPDQTWTEPESLDEHNITQGYGLYGITATRNLQTIYVGRYIRIDDRREYDLLVSYWDSTRQEYTFPKRLNINVARQSKEQDPNDFKDWFPSVSLDGRHMVFTSTRDTNQYGHHVHHIYQTRLLVDQTGDSVDTGLAKYPRPIPSQGFRLSGNYPNPFNSVTTIRYQLPEPMRVRLAVFNLLGRRVALLENGIKQAGSHEAVFKADHLSTAVYIYRLRAGGQVYSDTITLMK